MRLDESEARIFRAIRQIGFGELRPDGLVPTGEEVDITLSRLDHRLLDLLREYGCPSLISVADGHAQWMDIVTRTPAGLGKKRIRIT